VELVQLGAVQAVGAHEHATGPQHSQRLTEDIVLLRHGRQVVEHRERADGVERRLRKVELRRIAGNDLDIRIRDTHRELRRHLGIDLDGDEMRDTPAQPLRRRTGPSADLEHCRPKVEAIQQRIQDFVVQVLGPFGRRTQSVVHIHDLTVATGEVVYKSVGCQPVSGKRQGAAGGETGAVTVCLFPMTPGTRFDWHTHEDHQLAWASSGVLTVLTESATWVLPPTRALWIPAGLRHEVHAANAATMRPLYIRPDRWAAEWGEPTPVEASPLLAEMIDYLATDGLDAAQRSRAEALLNDLLRPVEVTTVAVRMPVDDRAHSVATGIVGDPTDHRTLAEWGHQVGASDRTLARMFLAETGMQFGRWRALARLQAALPRLAAGEPIGAVAVNVGYESTSAFVAAFHREIGVTPAAYFRAPRSA
jgi:AraC-like DNA-binding protein/quercetin dioxygenase-like cupin family protein